MKNLFFFSIVAACCAACSNGTSPEPADERTSMVASIDSLQKKMFNQQSMEVNTEVVLKEVQLYQDFVKKFPQDSMSAEYLFRASDLTVNALHDSLRSMQYLKQICADYPNYKRIPECLFMQGFYYQDRDSGQAKIYYNQLIQKYPDHPFADDAKASMQHFGKSIEEIISGFEKKEGAGKKN